MLLDEAEHNLLQDSAGAAEFWRAIFAWGLFVRLSILAASCSAVVRRVES